MHVGEDNASRCPIAVPLRAFCPPRMSNKHQREQAILQLIGSHQVASQEDLKALLAARGLVVTQATLSRDLRDLGVVRAPGEDGSRYMRPEMVSDEAKPSLEGLLPQLFSRVDG